MIKPVEKTLRATTLVVLSIIAVITLASLALAERDASVYPGNLYADSVSVGHLNRKQAEIRLQQAMDDGVFQRVFQVNQKRVALSLHDLGIRMNTEATLDRMEAVVAGWTWLDHSVERGSDHHLSPVFDYDDEDLEQRWAALALRWNQPAVGAQVHLEGDRLIYTAEQPGYRVDVPAAVKAVQKSLTTAGQEAIELPTTELHPEVTLEQIKEIKDLLAVQALSVGEDERDRFSASWQQVSGVVILPGDTALLSMKGLVGAGISESSRPWSEVIADTCREAGIIYEPSSGEIRNPGSTPVFVAVSREPNLVLVRVFGTQIAGHHRLVITREHRPFIPLPRRLSNPAAPDLTRLQAGNGSLFHQSMQVYRNELEGNRLVKRTLLGKDTAPPPQAAASGAAIPASK